ncbi:hypothetical protein [Streptomyces sp. NPDC058548]|uniref:hypothetical protein n=1 Tax=Streptomyces sp. NPDC058548 TaxID=3346545 RepID=UPI0036683CF5
MTQKPRRSSRAVQAREAAREKAARFREREDERLRIAESVILIQDEIDDFDAETERRIAMLRQERDEQLIEKRQKLDALVVEMLDTEIPAQEAAERLGLSIGQVRSSKRSFEQTVSAHALAETPGDVTATAAAPASEMSAEATGDPAVAATDTSAPPAVSESYSFPPPGGSPTVPAQEGSPGSLQVATLPPGSAG